jgi:transposase
MKTSEKQASITPTVGKMWANNYARRKFDEALKVLPASQNKAKTAAQQGLNFCNQLFSVERELKKAAPEKRYAIR